MKNVFLAVALLIFSSSSAFAAGHVKGYVRHDGTYVAPHYKTAPDRSVYNNYSTQGNVNPYTGNAGTVNPYAYPKAPKPPSLNSGTYSNPYDHDNGLE